MKAWLFTGAHEPLQLIERENLRPGTGEVILEVRAAGLCHSDVGCLEGVLTPSMPKQPPVILGHEIAGVVAEIGEGVSDFKVGDRVVASGNAEHCPGWSADGGYASHCLMSAAILLRLPDGVSFEQGAAATDAGQTSHSAVMTAGQLKPGQRVGIIGLGGLGMTGARIAVLNGAEVYAAEPRKEAWPLAKQQGVIELVEDVRELASYALDLIVDFAGFGETTAGAISAIRPGGLVVQVGLGRTEALINTMELVGKAVTLRGNSGGQASDTAAVLRHMENGDLAIQTTSIGFDQIPDGLERLKRGGVVGRLVAAL